MDLFGEGTSALSSRVDEDAAREWLKAIDQLAGELQLLPIQRRARSENLALYQQVPGASRLELAAAEESLGAVLWKLGDLTRAGELFEGVYGARKELLASEDPRLLGAQMNLASLREGQGDLEGALELYEEVHSAWDRLLAPGDPRLMSAKQNLALTRMKTGDLRGARELLEQVHGELQRTLPPEHLRLIGAKQNLASLLRKQGELGRAHQLFQEVHEVCQRVLPEHHPRLLSAKQNLAVTSKARGDLPQALTLIQRVHDVREEQLPSGHPDLLEAKQSLGTTLRQLGDLKGAHALLHHVHEARVAALPSGHPDLLGAKQNLASVLRQLGDLWGASEIFRHVHGVLQEILPADHPDLLSAKYNLAITLSELGETAAALELFEYVHGSHLRHLAPDHPDLLDVRGALALVREQLGDAEGALELQQQVHAARERTLPPDHPRLLTAKQNLALALRSVGDLPGALRLQRRVHEARSMALPIDHPDLLGAKLNLAATLGSAGDVGSAVALEREVYEIQAQRLHEDHPDLQDIKQNLASSLSRLGKFKQARQLEEQVHLSRQRQLPDDHPDLLTARGNLSVSRYLLGDSEGAYELASKLASGASAYVRRAMFSASPRECRASANETYFRLGRARVWHQESAPPAAVWADYFGALETARHVATVGLGRFRQELNVHDPAMRERVAAVRSAQAALDAHVAAGPSALAADELDLEDDRQAMPALGHEAWRQEVTRLSLERDETEKNLVGTLRRSGMFLDRVTVEAVAGTLDEGDFAIGFHRLECWGSERLETGAADGSPPPRKRRNDGFHYIAYGVSSSGEVSETDLGSAEVIDAAIETWRAMLGAPFHGRGFGSGTGMGDEEGEERAGRALTALVLNPLIARLSIAPRAKIHMCVDGGLHAVPIDGLPVNDAGGPDERGPEPDWPLRIGDRYDLYVWPSFARMIEPGARPSGSPTLLATGALDYGNSAGAGRTEAGQTALSSDRSTGQWDELPATADEVGKLVALARSAKAMGCAELTGLGATAAALRAQCPGKRYVHIATHGWFLPEEFRSMSDSSATRGRELGTATERTLTGFAPMTLCGLVLSGANGAETASERAGSLLTALELSSFDLRACDLAVLSACETNVGVARSGQGIQSLQASLLQAGARSALTSLWRVDDGATRDLMLAFYSNLWTEEMGKAEALWEAKSALRRRGEPVHHWAGWVLSGEPD